MESQIQRMVDEVRERVPGEGDVNMIGLGGDMRFAAGQLLPDWQPDQLTPIPVAALEDFTTQLIGLSDDRIVNRYHLSFPEAETVGPALLDLCHVGASILARAMCWSPTRTCAMGCCRRWQSGSRGRRNFANRSFARP